MDRRSPGWIGTFRRRAADNPDNLGFLLALGIVVLLGVTFVLARLTGAPTPVRGRIVENPVLDGRHGLEEGARISVDGRTFWLYLTPTYDCRKGDVIQLNRRRTLWGFRYDEAFMPRPCSRPGPADATANHQQPTGMKQ